MRARLHAAVTSKLLVIGYINIYVRGGAGSVAPPSLSLFLRSHKGAAKQNPAGLLNVHTSRSFVGKTKPFGMFTRDGLIGQSMHCARYMKRLTRNQDARTASHPGWNAESLPFTLLTLLSPLNQFTALSVLHQCMRLNCIVVRCLSCHHHIP